MQTTGDAPARADSSRPRLGHQPALDGLRGIAVVLVLLLHAGENLWPGAQHWLARGGALGVHLFFVLSGFLITVLLLEEHNRNGRIDLRRFAVRRARRLAPALLAVFGVFFVLACFGFGPGLASVFQTAIAAFTSTTNILTPLNPFGRAFSPRVHVPPELLHLWSLAIEVQFYALWGVALWLMTSLRWSYRRIASVAALTIVAVAVWRFTRYDPHDSIFLYVGATTRFDAPMFGALAGLAFTAGWAARIPRHVLAVLGASGLAALVWSAFTLDAFGPMLMRGLYTVLALGAALAVIAAASGPSQYTKVLANRPLVFLGAISYSLYLWHLPVFWATLQLFPSWNAPARTVVGIAASIVVAWGSYRFVERPFLQRKKPAATSSPVNPPA